MFLYNSTISFFFVGRLYALHHFTIALSVTPYFLPTAEKPSSAISFKSCSLEGRST